MTLANATLFFAICFAAVDPRVVGPSMPQSDSAGSAPASAQQAPSNQTAPESTKPSSRKPPSQTPAKKPKVGTGKKTSSTDKVAPAVTTTCDPVPTNGSSAGSNPEPPSQPGSTQEPSTSEPGKNCPTPPTSKKTIVQQGGIIEQSIQLAGGSSDETTKKRGDVNRLLKETDNNLKKLTGRQLSSEQISVKQIPQILQFVKLTGRQLSSAEQSSVSQIVQFRDESKTAADNGDLERADTLALKAQILSDDLVNPKK